ncbi:MAG TPA: hypothetical protein QF901_06330 [Gammaproteobacteria bacterium]|nr:hypothetical protein [Gammaproteobacteria bacterium]
MDNLGLHVEQVEDAMGRTGRAIEDHGHPGKHVDRLKIYAHVQQSRHEHTHGDIRSRNVKTQHARHEQYPYKKYHQVEEKPEQGV